VASPAFTFWSSPSRTRGETTGGAQFGLTATPSSARATAAVEAIGRQRPGSSPRNRGSTLEAGPLADGQSLRRRQRARDEIWAYGLRNPWASLRLRVDGRPVHRARRPGPLEEVDSSREPRRGTLLAGAIEGTVASCSPARLRSRPRRHPADRGHAGTERASPAMYPSRNYCSSLGASERGDQDVQPARHAILAPPRRDARGSCAPPTPGAGRSSGPLLPAPGCGRFRGWGRRTGPSSRGVGRRRRRAGGAASSRCGNPKPIRTEAGVVRVVPGVARYVELLSTVPIGRGRGASLRGASSSPSVCGPSLRSGPHSCHAEASCSARRRSRPVAVRDRRPAWDDRIHVESGGERSQRRSGDLGAPSAPNDLCDEGHQVSLMSQCAAAAFRSRDHESERGRGAEQAPISDGTTRSQGPGDWSWSGGRPDESGTTTSAAPGNDPLAAHLPAHRVRPH
jgi:hypothetical protein